MHEKVLTTERIYSGRIVTLDIAEVELPDGQHQKREIIRHPGAVAVIAFDADRRVLLVRQFRSAAAKIMLEIPAGLLNPAESPLDAASRELQEETGYKPGKIESLGGFYVAPGYTTEYIHLFIATDLIESRLPADEDEFIEVERYMLDETVAMIDRGDISDSKTIIGLLRVSQRAALP